jgi:transcriptional regulator with XRE-family HTH domain
MAQFDEALCARAEGDVTKYKEHLRKAFEFERTAAEFAANTACAEPTRSVLLRSAATLAFDCGEVAEAERLVNIGLDGEPPEDIKDDLLNIRKQIPRRQLRHGVSSITDVEVPTFAETAPASVKGGEDPGQRLKRVRERLGLRYRDVEQASIRIAERHNNDEFVVALSRLSGIENEGTIPTVYRLYALCAIYRLDLNDVLSWYGVDIARLPADAVQISLPETHPLSFAPAGHATVNFPLALDPGIDLRRTSYLSNMVQRWGRLPLTLLEGLDLRNHKYALVGSEDRWMYPLIQPGSLVLVDEKDRQVLKGGWSTGFDRPVYFVEHRNGYECSWCRLEGNNLVLEPYSASEFEAKHFRYPEEMDIVGRVTGVAMRLETPKPRRLRG